LSGWKDWQIGEVVEAAEFQTFLQDQVVQVYADSSARGSALGTAVAEGMVSFTADNNAVEVYNGTDWVGLEGSLTAGTSGFTALSAGTAGISYQPVSHNYVINGAFDVWQRGTTFSNYSTSTYTADRWVEGFRSVTATTFAISQQAFTPAELNVVGSGESQFYARFAVTTAGTSLSNRPFTQRIENVRTLAGQSVTLSFWAKADSARTLTVNWQQVFGSGGSATTGGGGATRSLTTSWQRFTYTTTIGSVSGKTIGTNSYLEILFQIPLADGLELDLWGVQLEAGSVATPFKRHAPSLQGELAACQRYYWRQQGTTAFYRFGIGHFAFSTAYGFLVDLPVTMRATPSVVPAPSGSFETIEGTTVRSTSAPSLDTSSAGPNGVSLGVTTSGATGGNAGFTRAADSTTTYIEYIAEL
jgi:hypothetical protein